jgi:hypothetical protein
MVPAIDTAIEPPQPSLFEKKTNMRAQVYRLTATRTPRSRGEPWGGELCARLPRP